MVDGDIPPSLMVLFLTRPLHRFFVFKFDPTLISHNSGLRNYSNKNHHIFRKPWTSAFRWHTLDTTEKFSNLRKKRLCLHCFGPLWTISTGNQWGLSEVGRLSYFMDYAHFTFPTPFDHFHSHPTLGLDPALILTLRHKLSLMLNLIFYP